MLVNTCVNMRVCTQARTAAGAVAGQRRANSRAAIHEGNLYFPKGTAREGALNAVAPDSTSSQATSNGLHLASRSSHPPSATHVLKRALRWIIAPLRSSRSWSRARSHSQKWMLTTVHPDAAK